MFKYLPRGMNGIFAIEKPSGVTSSKFLSELQDIFTKSTVFERDLNEARSKAAASLSTDKKWSKERINKKVRNLKVKIGHGGTLDPLARGVLVVGVGTGTKKLLYYLGECNKTYETKALLGISTTTGDSEGEILTQNQIKHISKDIVAQATEKFIGDLKQTPPIFSALKMNGKPLYDYAREGIPLPKEIKTRNVKIFDIKVSNEDCLSTEHEFRKLEPKLDENGEPLDHRLINNPTLNDHPLYFSEQYLRRDDVDDSSKTAGDLKYLPEGETLPEKLPMIHFTASVSSGTYIRSLVSDIGRALDSSAYMVELIRTKQSDWELNKNVFKLSDFIDRDERIWGPVLKTVFDQGPKVELINEFEKLSNKLDPLIKLEKEKLQLQDDVKEKSIAADTLNEDSHMELPKKRKIEEVNSV